ncbi:MAG: hypothetical protein LBQ67_02420 [Treponema sp.]|nr:hypothetical protein [Treponema sp.]
MKNILPFIAALFLAGLAVQAQESGGTVPGAGDSQTVYVIRNINFDVDGRSRPFALIYNGEFKEGERIQGKEELEQYISRKTQLLINQRVLEEVSIEYALGEREGDGAVAVNLLVHVKDTWNIIALPYPKYDSNDGLSFTIKARDYNFFGTMSALRVDLGYRRYETENNNRELVNKNRFNFEFDSDIPFKVFGYNWNLNFDHILYYTIGDPLYYQNVTGISMELPFRTTTFTFGFNQYLIFNEENSDESKELYGLGDFLEGPYAGSEMYTAWKIPTGLTVGRFGDLSYTPRVSGRVNYRAGGLDEPRKPVSSFSHSLGFGKVDWIGNYRKGLEASVGNGYSYYFGRSDAPFVINLDAGGTVYWPFTKLIGVSARLKYRQWWQHSDRINDTVPYYSGGDLLRGVVNSHLRAKYMLSLNLDLPFRILRFFPSEWFNYPPLHLFDFEMHFSPFVDLALAESPYYDYGAETLDGLKFSFKDLIMTSGFEVIVFPAFFRSFYVRGSVGYNISYLADRNKTPDLKWGFFPQWNEIYIGIGHHY